MPLRPDCNPKYKTVSEENRFDGKRTPLACPSRRSAAKPDGMHHAVRPASGFGARQSVGCAVCTRAACAPQSFRTCSEQRNDSFMDKPTAIHQIREVCNNFSRELMRI